MSEFGERLFVGMGSSISRTSAELAADAERKGKIKVIVVGAGSAGLGAARWLLDNDIGGRSVDVTVVEGRDRIGGRVHTAREQAGEENIDALGLFDLGASWIHSHSERNPISILAFTTGSSIAFTDFNDSLAVDREGKSFSDSVSSKTWEHIENGIEKAVRKARKLPTAQTQELSLEELCMQHFGAVWTQPVMQAYAADYDFIFGAPLHKCSATEAVDIDWLKSEDEENNFLFPRKGYVELLEGLVSGAATRNEQMQPNRIVVGVAPSTSSAASSSSSSSGISAEPRVMDIVINHEVVAVQQHHSSDPMQSQCVVTCVNTITSEQSQLVADAVIVTVPLAVLKASRIAFSPPLSPSKLDAIDKIGVGNVVKVVMEFPKVFWSNSVRFLYVADSANCNASEFGQQRRGLLNSFLNGFVFTKKKILVGYGLGDSASVIEQMSDEELLELIMQRMRSLTAKGHTAVAPIRIVRTKWGQDRFALGAYSYNAIGHRTGLRSELGRTEGRLWFAGEAAQESSLWHSSVHGAYLSGVTAAADISRQFGIPLTIPHQFTL